MNSFVCDISQKLLNKPNLCKFYTKLPNTNIYIKKYYKKIHYKALIIIYAKKREDRFPFDNQPLKNRFPESEGLPLPFYTPIKDLPPDGKTLTSKEESCDPEVQRCKTPSHVYETKCLTCYGTGQVQSKSKGRRMYYTCLCCHGLGYVRRVTSRFTPNLSENGPNVTLLRPEMMNGHVPKKPAIESTEEEEDEDDI